MMPLTSRQLGRRPTDPRRLAEVIPLTLTGVVPAHPTTVDHLGQVRGWVLGGNDRFGTCGPTSVANDAVQSWRYLLGEDVTVADADVFDLYRRSGNPGFDPATGDGDDGVDMTVMLDALVSGGITVTHADGKREVVKPLCYAKFNPQNPDLVRAVVSIFGGSLFGVDLEQAQQAQTEAGLWDSSQSPEWGGHAILGGGYTSQKTGRDVLVVTWAEVIGTTDAFMLHQLQEAFVLVWPALWTHPVFQAGVDQAALAADYQAATGRPFPVIVPPSPVPPPSPSPGRDQYDVRLWNATAQWAGMHHVGGNRKAAAAVEEWASEKGLA